MRVRIVGTDLPGRRFGEFENVHVGVQCRSDVVDRTPGDAARAEFEFDIELVDTPEVCDFRGPYVHGNRGARFLYLSWGDLSPDGEWAMFRRAKLLLVDLDAALLGSDRIEGALRLTDGRGGPRCASVRPPDIEWS